VEEIGGEERRMLGGVGEKYQIVYIVNIK